MDFAKILSSTGGKITLSYLYAIYIKILIREGHVDMPLVHLKTIFNKYCFL